MVTTPVIGAASGSWTNLYSDSALKTTLTKSYVQLWDSKYMRSKIQEASSGYISQAPKFRITSKKKSNYKVTTASEFTPNRVPTFPLLWRRILRSHQLLGPEVHPSWKEYATKKFLQRHSRNKFQCLRGRSKIKGNIQKISLQLCQATFVAREMTLSNAHTGAPHENRYSSWADHLSRFESGCSVDSIYTQFGCSLWKWSCLGM